MWSDISPTMDVDLTTIPEESCSQDLSLSTTGVSRTHFKPARYGSLTDVVRSVRSLDPSVPDPFTGTRLPHSNEALNLPWYYPRYQYRTSGESMSKESHLSNAVSVARDDDYSGSRVNLTHRNDLRRSFSYASPSSGPYGPPVYENETTTGAAALKRNARYSAHSQGLSGSGQPVIRRDQGLGKKSIRNGGPDEVWMNSVFNKKHDIYIRLDVLDEESITSEQPVITMSPIGDRRARHVSDSDTAMLTDPQVYRRAHTKCIIIVGITLVLIVVVALVSGLAVYFSGTNSAFTTFSPSTSATLFPTVVELAGVLSLDNMTYSEPYSNLSSPEGVNKTQAICSALTKILVNSSFNGATLNSCDINNYARGSLLASFSLYFLTAIPSFSYNAMLLDDVRAAILSDLTNQNTSLIYQSNPGTRIRLLEIQLTSPVTSTVMTSLASSPVTSSTMTSLQVSVNTSAALRIQSATLATEQNLMTTITTGQPIGANRTTTNIYNTSNNNNYSNTTLSLILTSSSSTENNMSAATVINNSSSPLPAQVGILNVPVTTISLAAATSPATSSGMPEKLLNTSFTASAAATAVVSGNSLMSSTKGVTVTVIAITQSSTNSLTTTATTAALKQSVVSSISRNSNQVTLTAATAAAQSVVGFTTGAADVVVTSAVAAALGPAQTVGTTTNATGVVAKSAMETTAGAIAAVSAATNQATSSNRGLLTTKTTVAEITEAVLLKTQTPLSAVGITSLKLLKLLSTLTVSASNSAPNLGSSATNLVTTTSSRTSMAVTSAAAVRQTTSMTLNDPQ